MSKPDATAAYWQVREEIAVDQIRSILKRDPNAFAHLKGQPKKAEKKGPKK